MNLALKVLRIIYPHQESQRMELRRLLHEAEANAVEISRLCSPFRQGAQAQPKLKINGHDREG